MKETEASAIKVSPIRKSIKASSKPTRSLDVVFKEYGEPFLTNSAGKVKLNERAVAAKCATDHLLKFEPATKAYQRFDQQQGLWKPIDEVKVRRLLGDLLLKLGEEWNQQEFVHGNKNSQFNSLSKMLQPYQVCVTKADTIGRLHVSNGVLDLNGTKPKLLVHDARYSFLHGSGVSYEPKSKCTRFLKELLGTALKPEDIGLLQKYCGSMLLGPNTCHGILVIRGTAGGGKSTLISVIEKVFGEQQVAQLRTTHLNGRFETSAFIGKRVLVGKDVPGDTLTQNGARLLKSLVGGDLLQAEIKYNPNKQFIRGDFHVIIASNHRLRVALDGDEDAWRRRLLLVDFENEKPGKPIPDFAGKLVAAEGSGILNWLIEGAHAFRAEMNKRGTLKLSEAQEQRLATLMHDSDSVLSFVEQCVSSSSGTDVTSEELRLGYYALCKKNRWTPVSGHAFQTRVPDLICERLQVCRRNDVLREGKAVRGYKHLQLNSMAWMEGVKADSTPKDADGSDGSRKQNSTENSKN